MNHKTDPATLLQGNLDPFKFRQMGLECVPMEHFHTHKHTHTPQLNGGGEILFGLGFCLLRLCLTVHPRQPGNHCGDQAGFKLRVLPASASRVVRLKVWAPCSTMFLRQVLALCPWLEWDTTQLRLGMVLQTYPHPSHCYLNLKGTFTISVVKDPRHDYLSIGVGGRFSSTLFNE